MKQATMFYAPGVLTQIDMAYITEDGDIEGMSLSPYIEVTGKVTEDESVVVDFSTAKKEIKALIDHPDTGVDHKLVITKNDPITVTEGPNNTLEIQTYRWFVRLPKDAVIILEPSEFIEDATQNYLSKYLTETLSVKYPGIQVTVSCQDSEFVYPYGCNNSTSFYYWHGLKDSTSRGCQNIAHGHMSYIGVDHLEQETDLDKIFGDTCFVYGKNITKYPNPGDGTLGLTWQYTTPRGEFYVQSVHHANVITILNTETTVENLVAYFAQQYGAQLKENGATKLWVSEGLGKGAMVLL